MVGNVLSKSVDTCACVQMASPDSPVNKVTPTMYNIIQVLVLKSLAIHRINIDHF